MKHPNQQIFCLWISQFLILSATSMTQPYWPLILKNNANLSGVTLSLYSALIYFLPLVLTMLTAPYWGSMVSRYGYKKMVMRAAIGLAVMQGLLLLSTAPAFIVFCKVIQGVFCGFTATVQAFGSKITHETQKGKVLAQLQSASALGLLAGPLIAGLIYQYQGTHALFETAFYLCLFCNAHLLVTLKEPHQTLCRHPKNHQPKLEMTRQSWFYCFLIAMTQVSQFIILPAFSIFVVQSLKLNASYVGILYALAGAGLFFFSPLIAPFINKKSLSFLILITSLIFLTFEQIIFSFASNIHLLYITRFLIGLSMAGVLPCLFFLWLQESSTTQNEGKVIGYGNSASKFGNLVGLMLGSFFLSITHPKVIMEASSVCYGLTLFSLIIFLSLKYRTTAFSRFHLMRRLPD